ncbi:hypothetical protein CC1G_14756 [Coprinopsis cinerea okayama7|uniref:F-box domain-containing protein n=1 Tax=Coprinopsis cinerea (strain Okayama-7 / 130 / ATCC MYA-4618 / FGSC 9003) TaxID=240176 RepID=D6RNL9_COPC7|nr:hypothetical protein CC1G_14756 [Coprinopsis cinerea okayama7\|eukprot:XP_002910778.1 hypothetical protein CC1G_14756 [Coprinopsis cinerea okayama7\
MSTAIPQGGRGAQSRNDQQAFGTHIRNASRTFYMEGRCKGNQHFKWTELPPEIRLETTSHMDINQLYNLQQVNKHRNETELELRRRVSSTLSRFNLDVTDTLGMLKTRSALISGSAALAVVVPGCVEPSNLDIYVSIHSKDALIQDIVRDTAYRECTPGTGSTRGIVHSRYILAAKGVLSSTYMINSETGKQINVMETTHEPWTAILAFHSTALMNAITHQGVVSIYGTLTCKRISVLNSTGITEGTERKLQPHMQKIWDKYSSCGLAMVWSLRDKEVSKRWKAARRHTCKEWSYCPQTNRTTADEGVITLSFSERKGGGVDIPFIQWNLAARKGCDGRECVILGLIRGGQGQLILF